MQKKFLYLDHAATTPLGKAAREAMQPFLAEGTDKFGNPSVHHHVVGQKSFYALEKARGEVAAVLGAKSKNIIFTSGATEANNIILMGFAFYHKDRKSHFIVGATEHKSVFETAKAAEKFFDTKVTILPVTKAGEVDVNELESILRKSHDIPTLVCLMMINNEIPVRHPVEDIGSVCIKHHAYFHCDAVQGCLRTKIDVTKMGASSVVISGHKIYGPKGVGVLVLGDEGVMPGISPIIFGGEQEYGVRPGTQNVMTIAGFSAALQDVNKNREHLVDHMRRTETIFIGALKNSNAKWFPTIAKDDPMTHSVPGLFSFWIQDVNAQELLRKIPHICLNRGAACTGGGEPFSHVPRAIGLSSEIASNVIRASFGEGISEQDAAEAVKELVSGIKI